MIETGTFTFKRYFSVFGVFTSGKIAFVQMLCVKVEGKQFDIIYDGDPTTRQVKYIPSLGELLFGTSFGKNAKIFVMYKR